jgi:Protein of unknown function (DUF3562)
MNSPNQFNLETNHQESIKALAAEIDVPVEEVGQIFTSTIGNLKTSARIQDYLQVLAIKKVRDALRRLG